MWSHQLRNNNPYRNTHKNKLNKKKKKIYAFPDLSPLLHIIKYDVGVFVVEGRGRNRFGLGKGYHSIHIQSIEKVIIDGKHDARNALKVWVNGIGLSYQQQIILLIPCRHLYWW